MKKSTALLALCVVALTSDAFASPRTKAEAPARQGAPIRVVWGNCDWGPDFKRYFDEAGRRRDQELAKNTEDEVQAKGVVMVNRPWGRLTITAVAVFYENSSVYFREPPAVVVREMRAQGFKLKTATDFTGYELETSRDDVANSAIMPTDDAFGRAVGRTNWWYGV